MATENIVITIREDGSREVSRNLRDVADNSRGAASAVDSLKSALKGLVGALAINEIRRYADIWTQVRGKVNIFTHSVEETNQVMDRLYTIAQNTRQPIAAMGNSFHQLSIAGSALGASQEQLLTFTQAIGNALAVQGTDANTARGGILQLGQAMNEGIVRAQEYNSMINAMPIVLKTVANNLDGVGGSLAKLRQRMLEGKLYSKDFFAALLKGAPELAALFEKSGKTIGQSFTVIENAMVKYVGRLDEAYGVSAKFYDVAKLLADNIDLVVKSITILVSPFILQGLVAIGRSLLALNAAALANPFVALAAAATMAVTALVLYRNQLILIEDGQVSLGDYMAASWERITELATTAANYIGDEFPKALEKAMGNITGFNIVWSDITSTLGTAINTWIGWFVALPKLFIKVWDNVPGMLYNIFVTAFNSIKGQAADFMNGLIDAINPLMEKANLGKFAQISFEQSQLKIVSSWEGMAGELGDIIKDSVNTDYIGKELDTLTEKAKRIAKERQAAGNGSPVDLGQSLGAGEDFAASAKGADKLGKELLRLEKQLASVVSAASPAEGALLKLNFAESVLEKSLAKGLLTRDQYNKYLALTREHYAEIANPMGELIKKIGDEEQALQLNARAREVEVKALAARRDLMAKGAYVDEKDLQMLRDRYTGLQKLTEAIQAQDALLSGSVEKRRAFVTQLVAIKKLLDDSSSGFSAADGQQALFEMNPEAFAGTRQYVDNVVNSYRDMFTQIQEMRNQDLISQQEADQMRINQTQLLSQAIVQAETEAAQARLDMNNGDWADSMLNSMSMVTDGFTSLQRGVSDSFGTMFQNLTDGFADSMAKALVTGEDLGDMLRNVATSAVEMLISSLIKLGIQWAIQAALSATLGAATTAAGVAMAATTAAAWAPAAAAVSLATMGANAGPASLGAASTFALTKTLSMAGMAHDGISDVPKEGTWLLDKGERVVDSRTNGDLKDFLSEPSNKGASGGGRPIIKLVINNSISDIAGVQTREGEDEDGNPQLEVMIDHVESALAGRVATGRGPLHKSFAQGFGLTGKARN